MYTFFISSWRVLEYLGQAQPTPIERRRAKIARYQNLKNVKRKANSSRLSLMSDSERFSCQYFFCKAVLNKMIKTYSHIYQSNNLYFETYRFNSDVLQAVNERETKFIFSPEGKSVKISLTLLWRKYFQFKDAGFHFNILFVISLYTYSYSKWNSELSRINVHSDSALLQSFHARCFRVIVLIILNNIFKKKLHSLLVSTKQDVFMKHHAATWGHAKDTRSMSRSCVWQWGHLQILDPKIWITNTISGMDQKSKARLKFAHECTQTHLKQ